MSALTRAAVMAGLLLSPALPVDRPMKACLVHYAGKVQGVGLRALAANAPAPKARAVIYVFLSGGLAQQDSFDLKPDAAAEYRGEFKPIATRTPGVQICEHLPRLAQRSPLWALVRSLTHRSN